MMDVFILTIHGQVMGAFSSLDNAVEQAKAFPGSADHEIETIEEGRSYIVRFTTQQQTKNRQMAVTVRELDNVFRGAWMAGAFYKET